MRKLQSIVNQISARGLQYRRTAAEWLAQMPFECPLCRCGCVWPDRCCGHCANDLPWNRQACPRCAHPTQSFTRECLRCPPLNWDAAYSAFYYRADIQWALAALKQRERLELGAMLGQLLEQYLQQRRQGSLPDAIVPIPISPKRYRERGHNQLGAITQGMSRPIRNRLQNILAVSSTSDTKHQNANQRWSAANPFRCVERSPARIAILDDIYTTGSTLFHATEALRGAGAHYVEVWTVARTARPGYGHCHWLNQGSANNPR